MYIVHVHNTLYVHDLYTRTHVYMYMYMYIVCLHAYACTCTLYDIKYVYSALTGCEGDDGANDEHDPVEEWEKEYERHKRRYHPKNHERDRHPQSCFHCVCLCVLI